MNALLRLCSSGCDKLEGGLEGIHRFYLLCTSLRVSSGQAIECRSLASLPHFATFAVEAPLHVRVYMLTHILRYTTGDTDILSSMSFPLIGRGRNKATVGVARRDSKFGRKTVALRVTGEHAMCSNM